MINVRAITAAATLAVTAAVLTGAPVASAKGGNGIRVSGTCTQSSSSKLRLSRDNSGTEIEFEVDQNRNAVPWKVTLRRSGSLIASATVTTHAPSGSFSYRRVSPGAGTIIATATRTGERCTATATA
jgi:hypothetical protein